MNFGPKRNRRVNKRNGRKKRPPIAKSGVSQGGAQPRGDILPESMDSRTHKERSRIAIRESVRGFIWIWITAVALAAGAFILHLNIRFDVIQTGYSLSEAQAEQRRLRLQQRELRLELATLKAPHRIEQLARDTFGMERPDHEQIIRLHQKQKQRRSRVAARGR